VTAHTRFDAVGMTQTSRIRLEQAFGTQDRVERLLNEPSTCPTFRDIAGRTVWDANVTSAMVDLLLHEAGPIGRPERFALCTLGFAGNLSTADAHVLWGSELVELLEVHHLVRVGDTVEPAIPALANGLFARLTGPQRTEVQQLCDQRSSLGSGNDAERLDYSVFSSVVESFGLLRVADLLAANNTALPVSNEMLLLLSGSAHLLLAQPTEAIDILCDASMVADTQVSQIATAWLSAALALSGESELGANFAANSIAVESSAMEFTRRRGIDWVRAALGDSNAAVKETIADAKSARQELPELFEAWAWLDAARFGRSDLALPRCQMLTNHEDPIVSLLARTAICFSSKDEKLLTKVACELYERGFVLWACEIWVLINELRRKQSQPPCLSAPESNLRTPILQRGQTPQLTKREVEIVRLAIEHTSADVAERLFLSVRTVDNLLGRVYKKLGVTNRKELAAAIGISRPASLQPSR
jgi:DNA-binding CsgD family transcriptional regulator